MREMSPANKFCLILFRSLSLKTICIVQMLKKEEEKTIRAGFKFTSDQIRADREFLLLITRVISVIFLHLCFNVCSSEKYIYSKLTGNKTEHLLPINKSCFILLLFSSLKLRCVYCIIHALKNLSSPMEKLFSSQRNRSLHQRYCMK